MRRLLLAALAALVAPAASAQEASASAPIRAWLGPSGGFHTNFDGIGANAAWRFTIERMDTPSLTVALGFFGVGEGDRTKAPRGGNVGYGALLVGKSVPLGDVAFAHVSTGVGFAQGEKNGSCTSYTDCWRDARGAIVPVRLEIHVATSQRVSIGASIESMAYSPVGSSVGLGLHANYGLNMRGRR